MQISRVLIDEIQFKKRCFTRAFGVTAAEVQAFRNSLDSTAVIEASYK